MTVTNPKSVSWTNPTQAIDPNGATIAWDPATDLAAIEIQIDGTGAVSVPVSLGATSFALTSLSAYQALAVGAHSLGLAIVTKEGAVSPFSGTTPFLRAVVPLAPTAVVLA